jgi:hypothetical protein
MSDETSVDAFASGEVTNNVSSTEAIPHCSYLGDTVLRAERLDNGVQNGFDGIGWMEFEPVRDAEVSNTACEERFWGGVSAEDVGDYDEVSCSGEVVGETGKSK